MQTEGFLFLMAVSVVFSVGFIMGRSGRRDRGTPEMMMLLQREIMREELEQGESNISAALLFFIIIVIVAATIVI